MVELELNLAVKILIWVLVNGGAGAAAFAVWMKLEKYSERAKAIPGEIKRWLVLALGAVVSLGAYVELVWYELILLPTTPQSWVNTIVAIVGMSYIASQKLHARLYLSRRKRKARV